MKIIYSLLFIAVIIACQPQEKADPSEDAFLKNSETILKSLNNWANETPDYSIYDENIVFYSTNYFTEAPDSTSLEQSKVYDAQNMERYDFEIMGELNPLPGVNAETRKMDGSVRIYVTWKVTKSATDSTSAKSAMIPVYHTYEFNNEGKIISQMGYGNFGGLVQYLEEDNSESEM